MTAAHAETLFVAEMWARICARYGRDGQAEIKARSITLRQYQDDVCIFELTGSHGYITGYLHGRLDGEGL